MQKSAAQHLDELEQLIRSQVKEAQENPKAIMESEEPDLRMGSGSASQVQTNTTEEFDPENPNFKPDEGFAEEYKQASFLAKRILNDMKKQGQEKKKVKLELPQKEEEEETEEPEEKKASLNLYKMGRAIAKAAMLDIKDGHDSSQLYKLGRATARTAMEKISADVTALRPRLEALVIEKLLTDAEKELILQQVGESNSVDGEFINRTSNGKNEVKKILEEIYLGPQANTPDEAKIPNPQTAEAGTKKVAWLKRWGF